ncbi:MAG: hypothetical protein D6703_03020 [Zetaproteobacteria bacterium]|nr:MAG: hypothetical protein D6703_03020 [Zetaproteobacteria bacterium]
MCVVQYVLEFWLKYLGGQVEQQVSVIAVKNARARVRGLRKSACGGCAGEAACSTLGSWQEQRFVEMEVENPVAAREGDIVTIHVPDTLLLRAAFLAYGLPMLGFLLGGSLGYALSQGAAFRELISVLSALFGMGLVMLVQFRCRPWVSQPMGRIIRIDKGRETIQILPGS